MISASLTALIMVSFIPNVWLFDIASQLRLAIAAIVLVCMPVLLILRAKAGFAIALLGFTINAVPILSMYLDRQKTVEARKTVTILNFNSEFQHNNQFKLFETLVAQKEPDLVALVEVDKKWIDSIDETMKRYKYKKIYIVGPGMAYFSKFPIEESNARYYGKSHHPRITATIRIGNRPVQLVLAHPTTPKNESGYLERNQEISLLKKEMAALNNPKVLIGDLNCGPWSPVFADLLKAGLRDSQQGIGPQPSWPARTGRVIDGLPIPPLVPIDHVLVSQDIIVLERTAGPSLGSDHLPVLVKIALPE